MTDLADAPEIIVTCEACGGEGAVEVWESVSKWSIDPPSAHCLTCEACAGAGFFVEEDRGDA